MADLLGSGNTGLNTAAIPQALLQWDSIVEPAAARYNLDPALVYAVMQEESGGDPNAVSSAGAIGLMQVMPFNDPNGNLYDPTENVNVGCSILRGDLDANNQDLDQALQSYNGGSYRGPDTAAYAANVEALYAQYSGGSAPTTPTTTESAGQQAAVNAFFNQATLTQGFGCTGFALEPAYGNCPHFHMGKDYAGPDGIALPSVVNGTVSLASEVSNGYGIQVDVDFGNGCYCKYGHMRGTAVQVGDVVSIGDTLGWQNNTGASTGSHVHIGVWCNDVPTDPSPWIDGAIAGTPPQSGPSFPSPPPPAYGGGGVPTGGSTGLPDLDNAWDGLRANVNQLLPYYYGVVIDLRGQIGPRTGGSGTRIQ